ncbi:alpha/beta fold hydrolase [Ornithinimicrobium cryptoxanthini]|uniref:alpha/beta fold hydrolase n=1 Tax=Ornithinimicrobium cryptoxanthini TaxID=2934161 RepID=UPI002117A56F|nr:alpha/beta hydrolase [Ornithinimicrobium cryptoxanthini]
MTDSPDPTPLVLLHGLGQAPMAWEDVIVPLYPSRRLLTPWVPGLKPTDKERVTVADAAAKLDTDLMLEGMQAVDLGGQSYGAVVATRLAADFPERVRRLVLIAGLVRPPRALMKMQLRMLKMMPASRLADSSVSKERLLHTLDIVRNIDLTDALPKITAPTLVLIGSKDVANRSSAQALASGIPGAQLREVPGAGHQVNVEQPKALVEILREFLD